MPAASSAHPSHATRPGHAPSCLSGIDERPSAADPGPRNRGSPQQLVRHETRPLGDKRRDRGAMAMGTSSRILAGKSPLRPAQQSALPRVNAAKGTSWVPKWHRTVHVGAGFDAMAVARSGHLHASRVIPGWRLERDRASLVRAAPGTPGGHTALKTPHVAPVGDRAGDVKHTGEVPRGWRMHEGLGAPP
jgi:hypothetical protein